MGVWRLPLLSHSRFRMQPSASHNCVDGDTCCKIRTPFSGAPFLRLPVYYYPRLAHAFRSRSLSAWVNAMGVLIEDEGSVADVYVCVCGWKDHMSAVSVHAHQCTRWRTHTFP